MTRQKRYILNLKARLLEFYGNACGFCNSSTLLEFAHTKETGLKGMGRGLRARYLDINRNKDCYIVLCKPCHKKFDEYQDVPF